MINVNVKLSASFEVTYLFWHVNVVQRVGKDGDVKFRESAPKNKYNLI